MRRWVKIVVLSLIVLAAGAVGYAWHTMPYLDGKNVKGSILSYTPGPAGMILEVQLEDGRRVKVVNSTRSAAKVSEPVELQESIDWFGRSDFIEMPPL